MCSFERVYFLPYWIERWKGFLLFSSITSSPLSITFFLYGEGAIIYERVMKTLVVPSRLNIIAHFSESAEPYPINMLRNIAIDGVTTSHFWLADMDMWPACFATVSIQS